ncbi:hypothetical protein DOY81_003556, partial [Sarcophaga bullata]
PREFPTLATTNAKVSIIITYHNESQSILYMTIKSILKRTPLKYLQEIIIIDDCSSEDDLMLQNIGFYFAPFDLIKGIRNPQRLGVIKSRNLGAMVARGDYIMFMDSHCEVNEQWLEPLLSTIVEANNPLMAVSPVLDNIDARTKKYKATSEYIRGGFDWNLHFHWIPRFKVGDPIVPFRSPTFAGGVFLISRNWFFKLKAFNTRLKIWGGESLEFSLKLWLCGGDKGEIKIVPCSRVGHIFRKEHVFQFPNNDGQQNYLRNSKIIAETWLEHYKYFFYNLRPEAREIFINDTHAAEDKLFKESLNCHTFEWYLQHIYPELRPFDNYTANGVLSSSAFVSENLCLHYNTAFLSSLQMCNCLTANITHWFLLKSTQQLQSNTGLCLSLLPSAETARVPKFIVTMASCFLPAKHSWQRYGLQLRHSQTGLCLEITVEFNVSVSPCRREAAMQYFKFDRELERL